MLAVVPLVVYQELALVLAVGTGKNWVWRGRGFNLVKRGDMVGLLGRKDL